ncbi:hypothetical protein QR680_013115 [Steinernema hermaphroditum]|uniref:Nose resistant-to-fluoxetine protein N-terminal domain-containing protein n=1 Tax=Steinernema hermaphroditum TaxID=289476 RepID=A0AA39I4E9_9BILA|nr:hypothetical protein QR680_013115 [Steinernema hermaphroditum]
MTLSRLFPLLVLGFLAAVASGCVLCPFRLPPRPRPIDQFRLPSIENAMHASDRAPHLCNMSRSLPVSEACRLEIVHLTCAVEAFSSAFQECPGTEAPEDCVSCSSRKAFAYAKNAWVITWLDSIGKMPSGISDGNYHWLGDFEQCERLSREQLYNGQYCMVDLEIPDVGIEAGCTLDDPLGIHLGICAPASCSKTELEAVLSSISAYKLKVRCEPPAEWSLPSTIFAASIILWLVVIICGTVLEVDSANHHGNARDDVVYRIAAAVSLRTNLESALRTKRAHPYHVVHGLQVLSLTAIVTANVYNWMMPYMENVVFSFEAPRDFAAQPIVNFSFHTDGLLVLSALGSSLLLASKIRSVEDVKTQLIYRILRVVPMYAFVTLFVWLLFVRIGSGPMWSHGDLVDRCSRSWWKNLLFINNMYPVEDTCIDGSYLMALEAQFFVVLVFLLLLQHKCRTMALSVSLGITVTSCVATWCIAYVARLPPSLVLTADPLPVSTISEYLNLVYTKPWTRAGSFFVGFVAFVFIQRVELGRSVLRRLLCVPIYLCIFAVGASVVWGLSGFTASGHVEPLFASFYAATHRLFWAFAVGALVFLLLNRPKDELGVFLGWRIFYPLSKHVYTVFLISEPVAVYLFSSLHRPIYSTHLSTIYVVVSTMALSYLIAFAIDIFVARPIRNVLLIHSDAPRLENALQKDLREHELLDLNDPVGAK